MSLIVLLLSAALLLGPLLAGQASLIPQEPAASSFLCAAVLLAALVGAWRVRRGGLPGLGRDRTLGGRAEAALAALFGLALLSLLWRVVADRGVAYLGPMLRAWTILGVELALFGLMRRIAQAGRGPAYVLLFVTLLASAIVAEIGVQEHLADLHAGMGQARIFATSTPDFLAGYLALLLPVTLALFVGVPLRGQGRPLIGFSLAVLLLVVLGYQMASLLWTQSRSALLSLAAGIVVLLASLVRARTRGLVLESSSRWRLAGIALFVLVIGARFAGPVLGRLRHTSTADNSTAFRLLTWRGSLRMAAANPVLGTGVGTYEHLYPRYAITGFTRLAHNSYIQMADECGLPGLLALLLTLGFTFTACWRGLSVSPPSSPKSEAPGAGQYLDAVAPADDRVLLCGLLGGLAAAAAQNLTDSDWSAFLIGITFWALAGLAVGLASPSVLTPPPGAVAPELGAGGRSSKSLVVIGALAAALLAWTLARGIAASYDARATAALAESAADSGAVAVAEQGWADAMQWDPLNARYPGYLGFQVYDHREGRLADAEAAVRTAIRLEPSGLNYSLLADILFQQRRHGDAVRALEDGLRSDPNSLDLRLSLAQRTPPPQSTEWYRQITVLEDSPVGRVRAIGGVPEQRFAIADAAVADASRDPAVARSYYARAAAVLEAYADEGGTTDIQRQVQIGDHPDPALDTRTRDLYAHVMRRRVALSLPADRPALQARAAAYTQKFADVIKNASRPGIQ